MARRRSSPVSWTAATTKGSASCSTGFRGISITVIGDIQDVPSPANRPLTPLSYAGVARRTTRRAVVGGAVVGGAYAAGAYVAAPGVGCYQVVDAYGRMIWRCP